MNAPSLFFRVSSDWMLESGQGDTAQVFAVASVTQSPINQQQDIITLLRENGSEWQVFPYRGRFVAPYTLGVESGKFFYTVATFQPKPGQLHVPAEFHTEADAMAQVKLLNAATHVITVAETDTATIDSLKTGASLHRLYRSGAPMKTVFTKDGQQDMGYFSIIDPKGNQIWIKAGTKVAVV